MDLKFKVFLFVVYLLADKLHEAAMFLSAQIIIARATTVLYTLTVVKHKTKFRPYFGLFTKKKKLSFLFCAISKLACLHCLVLIKLRQNYQSENVNKLFTNLAISCTKSWNCNSILCNDVRCEFCVSLIFVPWGVGGGYTTSEKLPQTWHTANK